jgi:putative transcriptional regulator
MDDNMFEQLKTSVEQAIDHAAGNMDVDAKRIHFVDEPNPSAIRSRLDLTQKEFAELLGISLGTVRNWEQGRRTPDGAAETLLRGAEYEPEALLRVAYRREDDM